MVHPGRDGIELLILRPVLRSSQHICKTLLICLNRNFSIIYVLDCLPGAVVQFEQIVTRVDLRRSTTLLERRQVLIRELHLITYVFPEAHLLVLQILGARNDLIDVHVGMRIILL